MDRAGAGYCSVTGSYECYYKLWGFLEGGNYFKGLRVVQNSAEGFV